MIEKHGSIQIQILWRVVPSRFQLNLTECNHTYVLTVVQLNGSDLVGILLLTISTAHKVLTSILLQLFWMNNPLLLDITESEINFQIK